MGCFEVSRGSKSQRTAIAEALFGLDLLSEEIRDKVITAWATTWGASTHKSISDVPFTFGVEYSLIQHINEVVGAGRILMEYVRKEWKSEVDTDTMLSILLLHDVDKPLLYDRKNGAIVKTALAHRYPHGVLGAMVLRDILFPDIVVSTVATHATNAPFHGENIEAYILHYADCFCADRAIMCTGGVPLYRR